MRLLSVLFAFVCLTTPVFCQTKEKVKFPSFEYLRSILSSFKYGEIDSILMLKQYTFREKVNYPEYLPNVDEIKRYVKIGHEYNEEFEISFYNFQPYTIEFVTRDKDIYYSLKRSIVKSSFMRENTFRDQGYKHRSYRSGTIRLVLGESPSEKKLFVYSLLIIDLIKSSFMTENRDPDIIRTPIKRKRFFLF